MENWLEESDFCELFYITETVLYWKKNLCTWIKSKGISILYLTINE